MANNPYVNKVVYGSQTIIDISDSTAVASNVISGKKFHTADGALKTGTIEQKSLSDVTRNGSNLIVPAGYYNNPISVQIPVDTYISSSTWYLDNNDVLVM